MELSSLSRPLYALDWPLKVIADQSILEMPMQNILSFLLPSALVLSSSPLLFAKTSSVKVAEADKSQEETEATPAPKTPSTDDPRNPDPLVMPKSEGTTVDAENEAEEGDGNEESSFILRQSKKTAAEAFVDYNTFQGDKEYFTPVAYGVKAYCFHKPDMKFGLSLAMEQLYFGFDQKILQSPGNFNFQNVKRNGSAIRLGAHSQFFLSDTLNIEASVFGASGTMKAGNGFIEDYYSRTGIAVAFGNQWSWRDYTFGLDWLTLTYNTTLKIGGAKIMDRYPSNRNGGMIVLSALSFGMAW